MLGWNESCLVETIDTSFFLTPHLPIDVTSLMTFKSDHPQFDLRFRFGKKKLLTGEICMKMNQLKYLYRFIYINKIYHEDESTIYLIDLYIYLSFTIAKSSETNTQKDDTMIE